MEWLLAPAALKDEFSSRNRWHRATRASVCACLGEGPLFLKNGRHPRAGRWPTGPVRLSAFGGDRARCGGGDGPQISSGQQALPVCGHVIKHGHYDADNVSLSCSVCVSRRYSVPSSDCPPRLLPWERSEVSSGVTFDPGRPARGGAGYHCAGVQPLPDLSRDVQGTKLK